MRWWVGRLTGAAGLVLVLLLIYGVAIEPRLVLDERRYEAAVPGLAERWHGTEVAVVADLQVGMWWANTGMVERVVDRVVDAQPDAVLLAGDFLYSSDPGVAVQVDTVLTLLAPLLDSGISVFAVLGNHDYAVEAAEELNTALEGRGVQVLLNESAVLPGATGSEPEDQLYVVGLGPVRPGMADADQALEGVPAQAPRIVMMHNPTAFPSLPAHSAPLAVAGHTHCGQEAVPGAPRWSYLGLTDEEALVADGYAPHDYGSEGNSLFVTCGIGFSVVPVRINAPPQVVFFTLEP